MMEDVNGKIDEEKVVALARLLGTLEDSVETLNMKINYLDRRLDKLETQFAEIGSEQANKQQA